LERVFFSGIYKDSGSGHALWSSPRRIAYAFDVPKDFPCREYALDGSFLPPGLPQDQGRVSLVHLNGWTIAAFWDRTGDSRGNSCGAFLRRGTLTFDEIIADARDQYPDLFERFTFPFVLYEG
jgi:hypothetical protein